MSTRDRIRDPSGRSVHELERLVHTQRKVLDALESALCILDGEARITSINRSWARGLGGERSPRNLPLGADYVEAWRERDFPGLRGVDPGLDVAAEIEKVVRGHSPGYSLEYACSAHGDLRWFQLHAHPIAEPAQDSAAVIHHHDITASVIAGRRLAAANEEASHLALVARYTDNSVLIADAEGRIEWVNEGFTRITGYTLEDARGELVDDLLHGADTDPEAVAHIRRQILAGSGVEAEILQYRKSGEPYWASSEVRAIRDEKGRAVRFISVTSDVTAKHAAENELREEQRRVRELARELSREKSILATVVATVPLAIFWKDRESRFLGCNERFARLGGLDRPEDVVGLTDYDFAWAEEAGEYQRDDREVIESGQPKLDIEEKLQDVDGNVSMLLTSKVPLRNQEGDILGVIGTFADVTALKQLEADLAQARKLESIGQLAAGIAHEINTPIQYVSDNVRFMEDAYDELFEPLRKLRSVSAALERATASEPESAGAWKSFEELDFDYLEEEIPKATEQSLEGLERVAGIVQAMREFSHPGTEKVATDLNAAIESTIVVARNEWKYVAELETDLDTDLGMVPCAPGDVKQVVLNMIVNAAHAIEERQRTEKDEPDGGSARGTVEKGHIRIATRRLEEWAEIRISDDGCGIPPENRSRVFDPFFTTKQVGKGTGQGLSISHGVVVKRHGGTLDMKSEVGRGTTFIIRLPLDPAVTGASVGELARS